MSNFLSLIWLVKFIIQWAVDLTAKVSFRTVGSNCAYTLLTLCVLFTFSQPSLDLQSPTLFVAKNNISI